MRSTEYGPPPRIAIANITMPRRSFGDRSHRRDAPDKLLIEVKAFKAAMHALSHAGIGMAVGEEGAVLEWLSVRQAPPGAGAKPIDRVQMDEPRTDAQCSDILDCSEAAHNFRS
jgi:hypothetical protein